MRGIPHYLIDEVDPDFHFEVNEFINRALKYSEIVLKHDRIPFFVGGSGLYLSSFFDGLSGVPEIDPEVRKKITDELHETSSQEMHDRLAAVDFQSSVKINPNDTQRIIRALEVFRGTGKPLSFYQNNRTGCRSDDTCFIGIDAGREYIYDRINNRVDKMLENGLINEVENILQMGFSQDLKSLNSIGYFEIIQYLNNKISLDEAVYLIKKNSRKYAKKQLTWFKRIDYINWFDVTDREGIYREIKNFLGC